MKEYMTKKIIPLSILIIILLSGCRHVVEPYDDIPNWLSKLIQQIEAEPVSASPGFVARYEYKGQIVYYLPQRCCDVPSILWDATGNVLCNPDGGFSGRGDGRCTDFFRERKDERIIWQEPRRHLCKQSL
jgi:hypothetical protein